MRPAPPIDACLKPPAGTSEGDFGALSADELAALRAVFEGTASATGKEFSRTMNAEESVARGNACPLPPSLPPSPVVIGIAGA